MDGGAGNGGSACGTGGGTGGGWTTFATRPSTVSYLAVDATNLYWIESGAVMKCATSECECNPTVVAPAIEPVWIAADGTSVYWTDDIDAGESVLKKCAATGCVGDPTVIATGRALWNFALDATNVYWIEFTDSWAVMTCPLAGCAGAPTTITTVPSGNDSPAEIVVGDEAVYWSNLGLGDLSDGPVLGCAKTGCSSPPVVIDWPTLVIAAHGSSLYWAGASNVETCVPQGSVCNGAQLAPAAGEVLGIAVDSDGVVYWTTAHGGAFATVQKCAPGCTGPITLASGLAHPDEPIVAIAVDATHVYWSNDNVIARTPK